METLKPYQRADESLLKSMDAALELVQGSFLAAAKLLDLEPQKFRNLINCNKHLKAKWGKRRGAQRRAFGFTINPYTKPAPTPPLVAPVPGKMLDEIKTIVLNHLSNEELVELETWVSRINWLRKFRDRPEQKENEQRSPEQSKEAGIRRNVSLTLG